MRKSNTLRTAGELRQSLGYISEPEAAGLIGITVATLRNRESAGLAPPHYKLGREKLFRIEEVDAWVRRRRVDRAA